MPFRIVTGNIVDMEVDAIVNTTNPDLQNGRGGVDGAIHAAAGPKLQEELNRRGGCPTGSAIITYAYNLDCIFVIHTVAPVWSGGISGERLALTSCYNSALELATTHGCRTLAFPVIASGAFGYPLEEAMEVAKETILTFLEDHGNMFIYLVLHDKPRLVENRELQVLLAPSLGQGNTAFPPLMDEELFSARPAYSRREQLRRRREYSMADTVCEAAAPDAKAHYFAKPMAAAKEASLGEMLDDLDESFSEMVMRIIEEKGIKPSQCYSSANITKAVFSSLRTNRNYKPKKNTAMALAVGLRLTMPEAESLLKKAGFAFSNSNAADIIVRYYIEHGKYDIFQINETLYDYDQALLGSI